MKEKLKDLAVQFLLKTNGRKTAIGIFLVVIGSIFEKFEPESGSIIQDIGWSIAGIGAAHKIVKGSKNE